MKTIPIRYIGKKPEHEDALYGTGLTWKGQGDVQQVPRLQASHMLVHTDVYEDARTAKAKKSDPITPAKPVVKGLDQVDELPLANLAAMTKEQLLRYNAMQFGDRVHTQTMTEAQLRQRIRDNMQELAGRPR
jgi:hypothetical protein